MSLEGRENTPERERACQMKKGAEERGDRREHGVLAFWRRFQYGSYTTFALLCYGLGKSLERILRELSNQYA